ncbi:MAG: mitochondrial fission ELM1 family protein [Bdellovibrionaceae bacterium]|nr:mitochondrial fission ELM1 family protein [Pseudobdellovibrionaceae bacterium]
MIFFISVVIIGGACRADGHDFVIIKSHLTGEMNSMISIVENLEQPYAIAETTELWSRDEVPRFIFHALGNEDEIKELSEYKRNYPNVKIINLHDPLSKYEIFDLILKSNQISNLRGSNVFGYDGIPSQVTPEKLKKGASLLTLIPENPSVENVAVLIGGDAKGSQFTSQHAILLARNLNKIRKNQNVRFLIADSRRTSAHARKSFFSVFDEKDLDIFFPWEKVTPNANPFFGILEVSKYLIVTGDSMSMISDCISTGKPTFVYAPDGSLEERHKRFVLSHFKSGRLKPLASTLEVYKYSPFNAVKTIASKIVNKYRNYFSRSLQCKQFYW